MNFISMFSGIEAASLAFNPLGWKALCLAEIEPFPSAVLAHHYPDVPNIGDMTAHDWSQYRGKCDVVVGGPPCQAFSVAGLRRSLDDDRGNLSLQYMKAIHAIDPLWSITENVPGWLSTKDNAFGCFLAGLVGEDAELLPPGGRWTDAGMVTGPERTAAWRCLDAQFFGLAQRRKRIFVLSVRGSGNWKCAAALFPISESLRWDSPPRREAGERPAAPIAAGSPRGSGYRNDADTADNLIAARVSPPITSNPYGDHESREGLLIAHTLKGEGFDASEDGTGRGVPIVLASGQANAEITRDGSPSLTCLHEAPIVAFGWQNSAQQGASASASVTPTLDKSKTPAICFSVKDHGADAGPISPTLRAGGFDKSHANGGVMPAVAFVNITETIYGVSHGTTPENRPDKALRAVRDASDEEAFSEWVIGVDAAFRAAQILQSNLHGVGIRRPPDHGIIVDDDSLPRPEDSPGGAVFALWRVGCAGRPPRGWQPPKQLAVELVSHLSELPRQGTPDARFMFGLWRACEGLGPLRQALSATEAAWQSTQGNRETSSDLQGLRNVGSQPGALRPSLHESQTGEGSGLLRSEVGVSIVRRLTPRLRECARLQGFPDDYLDITYRGKPAADGPRYRALGNSMAVPVIRWLGERIEMVERLVKGA